MNYNLDDNTAEHAIPIGSLVLVTGITGFIASHVADQLLQAGYRVRGTTRDEDKAKWVKELFASKYGEEKIETAIVLDMAEPGAFDQACEGVSGVAHVASDMSFGSDPTIIIPAVIAGALNAASAAAAHPSVKRFVYTSSSTAITSPKTNTEYTISTDQWNDDDVAKAWAPPPYTQERFYSVYCAGKTQAEQAMWGFVREKKPGFVLNTVLPNYTMGTILSERQQGSTAGILRKIYETGSVEYFNSFPPQWMVNVGDTARLHVAALIDPEVRDQRILAFAFPYNTNDVLGVLRKLCPGKDFPPDIEGLGRDLSRLDNRPGEKLLRKFGREGWMGLEESVRENIGV